jgi:DNA invertase Pin-like site-specific DNA recombinase
MQDLGLSAFTGEHLERGALGGFLQAVRSGKVESGSILLVESLDRLSRATVPVALRQFMDIIEAGVTIVTLTDGMEYSSQRVQDNWTQLITSLAIMARAHEESASKSKRIRAAWDRKKANAQERIVTSSVPAWLKVKDGKIVADAKKAATVVRIFELVRSGYGLHLLERTLNETKVAPIGRAKRWHRSYLAKMIGNRAVIGEYQPMSGRGGQKKPAGPPITDYFPRLISDEEFYATQQAVKNRAAKGGRKGAGIANVFSGLLRCGYCEGPVRYVNKNSATRWQYVVCSNAKSGLGCKHVPWNYHEFEGSVLSKLPDLDVAAILQDKSAEKKRVAVEAAEGELSACRKKLSRLLKLAEEVDDLQEIAVRVTELRIEEAGLIEQLQAAREAAAVQHLGERPFERFRALREHMEAANDEDRKALRLRVSSELKRFLERIDVYPEGAPPWTRGMRLLGIDSTKTSRFAVAVFKGGHAWLLNASMGTSLYLDPSVQTPPSKKKA